LVEAGCVNLARHISNTKAYGVNVVVAVNMFANDSEAELNAVRNAALAAGAYDAVVCTHHAHGGKGAVSYFFLFVHSYIEPALLFFL
jgi:formate--tetrahydrofolate ligase